LATTAKNPDYTVTVAIHSALVICKRTLNKY
jgi:hypothetical protein